MHIQSLWYYVIFLLLVVSQLRMFGLQRWVLPPDLGKPNGVAQGQLPCRKLRSIQKVKHSQVQAACVPTCVRSGAACGRSKATCQVFAQSLRHAWRHGSNVHIHILSRAPLHSAHGHYFPMAQARKPLFPDDQPAISEYEYMRNPPNVHEPVVMVGFLYQHTFAAKMSQDFRVLAAAAAACWVLGRSI